MRARKHILIGLFALGGVMLFQAAPIQPAAAEDAHEESSIVQIFTGVSSVGDFQEALEDARLQADAYYETVGFDIRYHYRILRSFGRRGGFAYINETSVTIGTTMEGG